MSKEISVGASWHPEIWVLHVMSHISLTFTVMESKVYQKRLISINNGVVIPALKTLPASVWLKIWMVLWDKSMILSTLKDRMSSSSRAMSPRKATGDKQRQKTSDNWKATQHYGTWAYTAHLASSFTSLRGDDIKAYVKDEWREREIYTAFPTSFCSVFHFLCCESGTAVKQLRASYIDNRMSTSSPLQDIG